MQGLVPDTATSTPTVTTTAGNGPRRARTGSVTVGTVKKSAVGKLDRGVIDVEEFRHIMRSVTRASRQRFAPQEDKAWKTVWTRGWEGAFVPKMRWMRGLHVLSREIRTAFV